tara:strand:- start:1320 stop:1943 length:624 start_codon:yes stop_codon:yes gene_type:complete
MYQKRNKTTTKLPIQRKGTKYVVRASSHLSNSVPVVIALRDMLKLAKTSAEVKKMITSKLLKINNKLVRSHKESIKLFNIFQADKKYQLILLPTGKFAFQETKDDKRLCKVIGKKLLKKNSIQINLHDGSNSLTSEKINTGDSVYLDSSGKVNSHVSLEKSKDAFIISGKYAGQECKIQEVDDKLVKVKFKDKDDLTELNQSQLIAK